MTTEQQGQRGASRKTEQPPEDDQGQHPVPESRHGGWELVHHSGNLRRLGSYALRRRERTS
jgi:hypothetical protein